MAEKTERIRLGELKTKNENKNIFIVSVFELKYSSSRIVI